MTKAKGRPTGRRIAPLSAAPARSQGPAAGPPGPVPVLTFLGRLVWLDGAPLLDRIEPYRRRLFADALDARDAAGRLRYSLVLSGRGKKNSKSLDLVLAALYVLCCRDSTQGQQCYILANDEDQAADDLDLSKKLIAANPLLARHLAARAKAVARRDGRGILEILPAQDVAGPHGKTYAFCGFDEIHGYRDWRLLEALQPDPHRPDAQVWITSYASLYHRPGAPLHDLLGIGKRGDDPRMLFSWYSSTYTTDPALRDAPALARANPSIASFAPGYLEEQQRRLPSWAFRRLHLNEPGLPAGAAYSPEPVLDAISRGVRVRAPEPGVRYHAFVDPSGGSNDAMTLGIAHQDADGRAVLDVVMDQGPAPPFDPRRAVDRFVAVLKTYGIAAVCGDRYGGQTFQQDFLRHGIAYDVSQLTASQCYEALEPVINGRLLVLLDLPELEAQVLGLVWRAGKITHEANEHDDWANAAAGACLLALTETAPVDTEMSDDEHRAIRRMFSGAYRGDVTIPDDEFGGNFLEPF